MGVVVPAVVEDLRVGGIGVNDQVEEGLGRIDRVGGGDNNLLVRLALLDGLDAVVAVGGGGGVVGVGAVHDGPHGLEGAVVDGGTVVELGVGVEVEGQDLLAALIGGLGLGHEVRVRLELGGGGVRGEEVGGHVPVPHVVHLLRVALDGEVVPVGANLAGGKGEGAAVLDLVAVERVVVDLALLGKRQLVKRRGCGRAVLGLDAGDISAVGSAGSIGIVTGRGVGPACREAQAGQRDGAAAHAQEGTTRKVGNRHVLSRSLG